jgi:hypothetical protein
VTKKKTEDNDGEKICIAKKQCYTHIEQVKKRIMAERQRDKTKDEKANKMDEETKKI